MEKEPRSGTGSGKSRLEDLEQRVVALEAAVFPENRQQPDAPVADGEERFWALAELKARAGERNVVLFAGRVGRDGGSAYEWQQGAEVETLLDMELDDVASALAALGHPVRLLVLQAVLRGLHSATELGTLPGLGTSGQLYHHLRELQATGWLRSAGRGHYEVPPARVVPLLTTLAAAMR
jgi:DNA-binding HxlR family transcriptional regulator